MTFLLGLWSLPVYSATYDWNTTTGNWDTTTANWSGAGATWVNGNDAVFSNTATASTITLNEAISAGIVRIGNGGNNANFTFSNGAGTLSATDFIVQGNPANGMGSGGGTPVSLTNLSLTTTGNLGVGRWTTVIGGTSTVNVGGVIGGGGIAGITSADWGTLTIQDTANVTATGGINGNTEAWILNLNGGTLTTPSIQASDREAGGNARLTFNGTTIIASGNNAAFVTVGANNASTNSALVGNGGAIFNSNGFDIGTAVNLKASGTGGLTKLGAGTLTLSGTNTYTGITTINRGTVNLANSSALGTTGAGSETFVTGADGVTSTKLLITTGTPLSIGETLNLNAGAGGRVTLETNSSATHTFSGPIDVSSTANLVQFSSNGSGAIKVTGDITGTMSGGSVLFLRGNSSNAANHLQGSVNLTGGDLRKTDSGVWTVGAAGKTYSWVNTQIAVGTLRMGANNVLPAGTNLSLGQDDSNAANLDLNDFTQTTAIGNVTAISNTTTANTITIDPGDILNVGGNFLIGRTGVTGSTTNLTASGGGNLEMHGTTVEIGRTNSDQNGTQNATTVNFTGLGSLTADVTDFRVGFGSKINATLLLSNTANTITVSTLSIGNSGTNNASPATMQLGTGTNVINADIIDIARGKQTDGSIKFASQIAGSPGTLTVRGKTGGISTADINVGVATEVATGTTLGGTLDLRGHTVDVLADDLTIGRRTQGGGGGSTGNVLFDSGTFTANTVSLAIRSGGTAGAVNGNLTIGGGTFTVNSAFTLSSKTDAGGAANATVTLTGGTLLSNTDILRATGTGNATLTLNGGILDLAGNDIGDGTNPIQTLNFQSGTLKNVASINGTDGLTKTTTGILIIEGSNSWTGPTTVNQGILRVDGTITGTSSVTVASGAKLQGIGTITTTGGTTINGRIAPGNSIGTLTLAGPVTLSGVTATAEFEIVNPMVNGLTHTPSAVIMNAGTTFDNPALITGATRVAGQNDILIVNGATPTLTFNIGSTLEVLMLPNTPPTGLLSGIAWDLIDAGIITIGGTNGFWGVANDYTYHGGNGVQYGDIILNLPDLWNGTADGYYNWNLSLFESHGIIVLVPEPSRAFLVLVTMIPFALRRRR